MEHSGAVRRIFRFNFVFKLMKLISVQNIPLSNFLILFFGHKISFESTLLTLHLPRNLLYMFINNWNWVFKKQEKIFKSESSTFGIILPWIFDNNVYVYNYLFIYFYYFQIYTDWANHYLEKARSKKRVSSLATDCSDGVLLAEVIESVSKFNFNYIFEKIMNKMKK